MDDIGSKIDRLRQELRHDIRNDLGDLRNVFQTQFSEFKAQLREIEARQTIQQQIEIDRISAIEFRMANFNPDHFARKADLQRLELSVRPFIRVIRWAAGFFATAVAIPLIALLLQKYIGGNPK
jgi:hypothetical protein